MATATLSHYGKGALRVAKNYTKGYSHTQAKVRDATSNDPWPPSGRQMHEIAQLTYNPYVSCHTESAPTLTLDILQGGFRRNHGDAGQAFERQGEELEACVQGARALPPSFLACDAYMCAKSLTLLDYLLHTGSENVILYFRENLYVVKTLREFQYIDEHEKDQGSNVRQKAKDIVNLLQDDARLRHERRTRARMYERMSRGRLSPDSDVTDDEENVAKRARFAPEPKRRDDDDLRRAMEESRRSMDRDRTSAEERDLQKAFQLSKEEEEKRAKALADANLILFDEG